MRSLIMKPYIKAPIVMTGIPLYSLFLWLVDQLHLVLLSADICLPLHYFRAPIALCTRHLQNLASVLEGLTSAIEDAGHRPGSKYVRLPANFLVFAAPLGGNEEAEGLHGLARHDRKTCPCRWWAGSS
ncbi:hypothetical protein P152DRAFT_298736 [Eremomyces bilateralis CBS 781.70]|uniref:Uncharacterized protein n=1 Tax=Eremomyces bilateralis CBS 781.70 TaxID=1392243 RepID=A0A6G1G7M5_9PEZI|nr:uncharacterized protein P152DRAFT_298736 [Eremomyces bilateralis CBS 781.70]KAF1813936.1 hypothetical protein P152DRAFT_298736 [Eremomyces bilateralis CBS 781.70]